MTPLELYALQGFLLAALIIALIVGLRRIVIGPERTVADRKRRSWS